MTSLDKFNVVRHLGRGFFGNVYLCFDPFLQKHIAVKVIEVPDPNTFVKAVKEGQALEVCRHNHIVDVKDVRSTIFNSKLVVIIVMEYLANGSVQNAIENKFISAQESCQIVQQALLGLEHAHNNNVLHRDIKPANILFSDGYQSKLSDFGFAIDYHNDISNLDGYRPHQPLEVIEGQPMDKLSDIYAMGITFYRLLNNVHDLSFPFSSMADLTKALKKDQYPSRNYAKHIPDKICRVLNKAINKNKDSRFGNCTLFRQAIEKLSFNIDWRLIDADRWEGTSQNNAYTLEKFHRRSGWTIEYKRNGKRRTDNCYTALPNDKANEIFISIVKETTLN